MSLPVSRWLITAFLLFVIPAEGADKITALFAGYNPKRAAEIAEIVKDTADGYGINPGLIAAIIVNESGVRPEVVSKGGDYGLMQVRWKVHRRTYPELKNSPSPLFDAETNIRIGTDIFVRYYKQKKTIRGALLKYSGGSRKYAEKVIKIFESL